MSIDWLSYSYGVASTLAALVILYRIMSGD